MRAHRLGATTSSAQPSDRDALTLDDRRGAVPALTIEADAGAGCARLLLGTSARVVCVGSEISRGLGRRIRRGLLRRRVFRRDDRIVAVTVACVSRRGIRIRIHPVRLGLVRGIPIPIARIFVVWRAVLVVKIEFGQRMPSTADDGQHEEERENRDYPAARTSARATPKNSLRTHSGRLAELWAPR